MRVCIRRCRMFSNLPELNYLKDLPSRICSHWQPDRVVVGNAVSRGNPQVEYLLRTRDIDFVSLPQLIGEDLIGNRPAVVVAGTHGKTTTSLTSFALSQAGQEPGYLIGGVPLDLPSEMNLVAQPLPLLSKGTSMTPPFLTNGANSSTTVPRFW